MEATLTDKSKLAINILLNIVKELLVHSDKYCISDSKFQVLTKAYHVLESYPAKKIKGYIDISANTHLPGGSLDYSSFTLNEDGFEIYNGFVSYDDCACDGSSWEKIFSTNDNTHRTNLAKALEAWAEGFLLHIDINPKRSLLIIDKTTI